jgi:hypothetical protein
MTQAPTSNTPYSTEASREEKAAIIQNEKRLNTRAAMQAVLDPTLAGRFAKSAKADFTVGRDEAVHYPRIAGGPWGSGPQVPDEPALGYSVEEMEVVEAERAAAIAEVAAEDSAEAGTSSPATTADLPPLLGSANSAGSSLPSAPQLPDVAAATARPFSKPSFRRIG